MKSYLHLSNELYDELRVHLLPPGVRLEQAAFLFAKSTQDGATIGFNVIEVRKLWARDFDSQEAAHLELSDETRKWLIKRAHDLGCSLIEMHSHPTPWPAEFSEYDRQGLLETVPHMWWRLANRPYVAIVVAPSGIDALVWLSGPGKPMALGALIAGTQIIKPTNRSLPKWQ